MIPKEMPTYLPFGLTRFPHPSFGISLCHPDSGARSRAPTIPGDPGPSAPGWTLLISGLGIGIGVGTKQRDGWAGDGTPPCDSGLRSRRTKIGFYGASPPVVP